MEPRWDSDDRGHGIADASRAIGQLDELRRLAMSPDWIAESPELHLLPHLVEACRRPEAVFSLGASTVDAGGALVVELHPHNSAAGVGEIRAAVVALVGQVAETVTYIRQFRDPLRFEVVTGIAPDEGPFATHGHLLTLYIIDAIAESVGSAGRA